MGEASVVIGGEAGDGVRAAGGLLGRIFNRHGLYVFVRDDYQSLIRGGHNFSQVRAGTEKVQSQVEGAEVVVALDDGTVEKHGDRLARDGVLLLDSGRVEVGGSVSVPLPMTEMVEEEGGPRSRGTPSPSAPSLISTDSTWRSYWKPYATFTPSRRIRTSP